jgi:predicted MFS family arabinose efflux permease
VATSSSSIVTAADRATDAVPPSLIVAAGVIGTAFLTLAPSFVGALVDSGYLDAEQAGQVASSHLIGLAVGPVIALLNTHRMRTRAWTVWGVAAAAVGHGACAFLRNFWPLVMAQFLAGAGAGLIFAVSSLLASGAVKPERVYSLTFMAMMGFGAMGFVGIPILLPVLGLPAAFGLAAALGLLLLPFLSFVPTLFAQPAGDGGGFRWSRVAVLALTALFLHYVANSAVWAYLDRIGVAADLDVKVVGIALAAGMLASVTGGLPVDRATARYPFHVCLMAGIVVIALATALLFDPSSAIVYGFAVYLYLGAMTFTVPIFQGLMASVDPTRRCVIFGNLILMVGQGVGPAVGSQLIADGSFVRLLQTSLVLFAVALVLVMMAGRKPAMGRT